MLKRNLLIVGGAGYIGSYINKFLHAKGYETTVFDDLSQGCRKAVTRGAFVQGSTGNPRDLEALFSGGRFDAILHFAGSIQVEQSVSDPSLYYRNNFVNTQNLLDAACHYGIRNVIFSSTAAIFGVPQTEKISEHHPKAPANPYGKSKLMVESLLQDYDIAYGLKSCSLRYFNAAGADPDGEIPFLFTYQSNLIPKILKSLAQGDSTVSIYGTDYPTPDGTCIRDYIHIHDLATAHHLALEELLHKQTSQCYNLGNGEGFSVREVVAAAEKATGRSIKVIEQGRRAGDVGRLVADASLARKQLNWKPEYPCPEKMISDAWRALPASKV